MYFFVPDHGHKDRRAFCEKHGIGLLYSPHRNLYPKSKFYIVDNGAYSAFLKGKQIDLDRYYEYLSIIRNYPSPPYFVTIPDIVAGGISSKTFSEDAIPQIPFEFKKYFVVQDGQYPAILEDVLPLIDGVFVGGSTLWKWRTAHIWVDFAHTNGIQCHIGRVGTFRNFLKAFNMGADSVDGSTLMRHQRLSEIITWREDQLRQKLLEKEEWVSKVEHAIMEQR